MYPDPAVSLTSVLIYEFMPCLCLNPSPEKMLISGGVNWLLCAMVLPVSIINGSELGGSAVLPFPGKLASSGAEGTSFITFLRGNEHNNDILFPCHKELLAQGEWSSIICHGCSCATSDSWKCTFLLIFHLKY